MDKKEMNVSEILAKFRALTRQGRRMYESQTTTSAGQELRFRVPRAKLLGKIYLKLEATLTAVHASNTSYTPHEDGAAQLAKSITVDINSGHLPFNISGRNLRWYNMIRSINGAAVLTDATSGESAFVQGVTSSPSAGTANTVRAFYELPFTMSTSEAMGLLPAQNSTTNIEVTVKTAEVADLAPSASGYTFTLGNVTATLYVEDYTIPADPTAIPPMTMIKTVNQITYQKTGAASETTFKLDRNKLVRALMFVNRNASSVRVGNSDITSLIQLILQADNVVYNEDPTLIRYENQLRYGALLPTGIYALDFGTQDLAGKADFRDFIDTSKLQEFWLRFTSATAGNVEIIQEAFVRLG